MSNIQYKNIIDFINQKAQILDEHFTTNHPYFCHVNRLQRDIGFVKFKMIEHEHSILSLPHLWQYCGENHRLRKKPLLLWQRDGRACFQGDGRGKRKASSLPFIR